jgi:hypothetical protein
MADYFINKLNIILEQLDVKAAKQVDTLMGKKSRWVDKDKFADNRDDVAKYIESLVEFDPTDQQGQYLRYIVDQLKNATIVLPEDGERLRRTLEFFHNNKNTQQWKSMNLPIDLWEKNSPIRDWRNLGKIFLELGEEEFTTKRQESRDMKKGAELVFEITLPNIYKTRYKFYKITEPEAAIYMGRGTQWCTTELARNRPGQPGYQEGIADSESKFTYGDWHPRAGETRDFKLLEGPADRYDRTKGYAWQAAQYMKKGPLYIVFMENQKEDPEFDASEYKSTKIGRSGQIIQFESGKPGGFGQVMGISNEGLHIISIGLDYALGKWAESDPEGPLVEINRMRKDHTPGDYQGRPPLN